MSKENLHGFYRLVMDNDKVGKELLKAANLNDIMELAKKNGFEFSKDEYDELTAKAAKNIGRLSDYQLDNVSDESWSDPIETDIPEYLVKCYDCGWSFGPFSNFFSTEAADLKTYHKSQTKHVHIGIEFC